MATSLHNLSDYDPNKVPDASNMCFGIVVAEWNPEITGALLDGAVKTLEKHGALPENIHVKTVPGSFELIYGAHQMTLNDGYDAIIILGCVIRGETPHFAPQRKKPNPGNLRTAYNKRPATGQRPQRRTLGKQRRRMRY